MSDLTAVQSATLQSLSQASSLFATTQNELNTGKKVNTVTDNAVAYFRSQALYNRSNSILTYKATIDQSVQSVQAALTATSAVAGLLTQLKGVLEGARGATVSSRVSATVQFKNIAKQLAQLVKDASYQGLNLLTSTTASLSTAFSERTAATFTINGYNLTTTKAGNSNSLFTITNVIFKSDGTLNFSSLVASSGSSSAVVGFSALNLTSTLNGITASQAAAIFTQSDNRIDAAINQVNAIASALGTNVAILQARSTFSANYASDLSTGGDKLTLADLNTAAANSQALSLRQQIGIQSLSVSGTQNSSILTLLR